jgi:hypothetical protein
MSILNIYSNINYGNIFKGEIMVNVAVFNLKDLVKYLGKRNNSFNYFSMLD